MDGRGIDGDRQQPGGARWRAVQLGLVVLLAVVPLLSAPARGASLSDNRAPSATPLATPSAAACTVEPRTVEEVIALWFEDRASTPTIDVAPTRLPVAEAALPPGPSADAATVAAVTAAVREVEACTFGGEIARRLALYTDDLLHRAGPPTGMTLADARFFLAAPLMPLPAEQRLPPAVIRDVRILADGQVGLVVTGPQPGVTAFLVFARVGERWLVDEVIAIAGAGTPTATTPAA